MRTRGAKGPQTGRTHRWCFVFTRKDRSLRFSFLGTTCAQVSKWTQFRQAKTQVVFRALPFSYFPVGKRESQFVVLYLLSRWHLQGER